MITPGGNAGTEPGLRTAPARSVLWFDGRHEEGCRPRGQSEVSGQDQFLLYTAPNGAVKGGRHIRLPQNTTHSNLLLTVLQKAGVRAETFGDSTGTVAEL